MSIGVLIGLVIAGLIFCGVLIISEEIKNAPEMEEEL